MKSTGLPIVLRLRDRPVILIGNGGAADAKRRLLERAGARVVDEASGEGARIAIVALDGDAEAEGAADRLRARGILVNVVDRPALCDFTLPAIIDRDPVLVAVATGGASAGLAAALRQRIEALLPAGIGELALALRQARAALRDRWPDAGERRQAIGAALSAGGVLDLFGDHDAKAVERWIANPAADVEPRMIALRLASPDPDGLTLAEARWLAAADRVFHRPDVPQAILDRARADAQRIACPLPPQRPGPGLSLDLTMAL